MKLFIVAIPLFSADMAVEAYRLCFHNAERLLGTSDDYTSLTYAMDSPGIDVLNDIGVEPFTGGKPIFVDINQFQLLRDLPSTCKISHKLMVCVISSDVTGEPIFVERCKALKDAGFQIALEGIKYTDTTAGLFALADYMILDTTIKDYRVSLMGVWSKKRSIRAVLTNIATPGFFDSIKTIPGALFEGKFYNQPLTAGAKDVSPLKVNALQLLKLVGEDNFELTTASSIIERDPSITISLLRFINSPGVGITQKIESIKVAVALLGQKETRKWIMAAISTRLSQDKPNEITRLSLIRAKFAENLAGAFELGAQSAALFLMGLFSLLDVILDKPIVEAIKEVAVDNRIKSALVERKGEFFDVLDLIYGYERADWQRVSVVMIRKNLTAEAINKAFISSLMWYKSILEEVE